MFKETFKYYKSRNPPPNFKNVIDFRNPDFSKVRKISTDVNNIQNVNDVNKLGLKPINDWNIYELINVPGLIYIENPFTVLGQRYWIIKCLKDFSRKPNKLNLDAHSLLEGNESWWETCFRNPEKKNDLLTKLRWATQGYHHNWDTKNYSEDSKTEMSKELCNLTEFLATVLHFVEFQAEAAIINYYRMNSTLAGHTDHSEINIEAPLFSISFGQSAIFLIGGHSVNDTAEAMFLRSGDIVVMSKQSRLCYHGVPRILSAYIQPWECDRKFDDHNFRDHITNNDEDWLKAKSYIQEARINLNVRQVLKKG
ncbi:nucleic acid dioxygenase ALKBH1 isoform X2 [Leptopilina boulardi]|nr:nucleic acid dioxygenase ALKBH1 isoform X2 [Leptopilina boulardi]